MEDSLGKRGNNATPPGSYKNPPNLTVHPTENEAKPAIYGPKGEVLRWEQREIGYRSTKDEA